jgi:hypothetical protein
MQWFNNDKILMFNSGYRVDIRDEGQGSDRLAHFDGEYSTPLFGKEGIEFNVSAWHFWWGDDSHNDFLTVQSATVWRRGHHWDFTLYQDWSNNTQLQSRGNINDEYYIAGEAKWKKSETENFRLLMGAYKAGIRCSGGQCRTLPGFQGAEFNY